MDDQFKQFGGYSHESIKREPRSLPQGYIDKAKEIGSSILDTGKSVLNTLNESAQDTLGGLTQGVTLGGADEIEGAIRALSEIAKTDSTIQDFPELFSRYQKLANEKYLASEKRSPTLNTLGNIAGNVATAALPFATGGAATQSLKQLLKNKQLLSVAGELAKRASPGTITGTLAGGLSSEGDLNTEEGRTQRLNDSILGGTLGGTLSAGGNILGNQLSSKGKNIANYLEKKMGNWEENNPYLRQLKLAYDLGKEKINPGSHKTYTEKILPSQQEYSEDLMKRIFNTKKELGENLSNIITENKDLKLSIGNDISKGFLDLQEYAKQNPAILADLKANKSLEKLFGNNQNPFNPKYPMNLNRPNPVHYDATPIELVSMKDTTDEILNKLKGDNSTNANAVRQQVLKLREAIDSNLSTNIPGYKEASSRFFNFLRNVPETLMSGDVPVDISNKLLSSSKNPRQTVYNAISDKLPGITRPGSGTGSDKLAFENFKKSLEKLKTLEQGKQRSVFDMMGKTGDDIIAGMKKEGDLISASEIMQGGKTNVPNSPGRLAKGVATTGGITATTQGLGLSAANLTGSAVRSSKDMLSKASNSLIAKPEQELRGIAQNLQTNGFKELGDSLNKALDSKSTTLKNATLFSILQNPNARKLVDPRSEQSNEEKGVNPSLNLELKY